MSDTPKETTSKFGRLFNYANTPIAIMGIVITTLAAVLIVIFLIVEVSGGLSNPYIGLFAYLALPMLFIFGLVQIPIGMWLRRSKLIKAGVAEAEIAKYPLLDFNDAKLRRVSVIVLGMTAINAIILGSISFMTIHKMETVEFCGTTCHEIMQPEYNAYQESPHSRITCVKCHVGPGATSLVKSKIDGLRQLYHTVLTDYTKPVSTPLHNLRPARETCENCHWPHKHHGDKLQVFARFGTDEASTPSYTAMLLKTGGGTKDMGQHGGIHWWHIYSDNKIRYIAGDERKEGIVWVELTTAEGEVRVYSREGDEMPSATVITDEANIMDCIDCHNRPTHFFPPPAKAIDSELEAHPEIRELPFFKKQAIAALDHNYVSHIEGVEGVHEAVIDYYRSEHPEVFAAQGDLVAKGADRVAAVYDRSIFPEMDTDWESHPNHIGHEDFPGCWRCHDDEMATADGEHIIPMDCETCHVFLVEDSEELPDFGTLLFEE